MCEPGKIILTCLFEHGQNLFLGVPSRTFRLILPGPLILDRRNPVEKCNRKGRQERLPACRALWQAGKGTKPTVVTQFKWLKQLRTLSHSLWLSLFWAEARSVIW